MKHRRQHRRWRRPPTRASSQHSAARPARCTAASIWCRSQDSLRRVRRGRPLARGDLLLCPETFRARTGRFKEARSNRQALACAVRACRRPCSAKSSRCNTPYKGYRQLTRRMGVREARQRRAATPPPLPPPLWRAGRRPHLRPPQHLHPLTLCPRCPAAAAAPAAVARCSSRPAPRLAVASAPGPRTAQQWHSHSHVHRFIIPYIGRGHVCTR